MTNFSASKLPPAPDPPMVHIDNSFINHLGRKYYELIRQGQGTAPMETFQMFERELNNNRYWYGPPAQNDNSDPRNATSPAQRDHRMQRALGLLKQLAEFDTARYEVKIIF